MDYLGEKRKFTGEIKATAPTREELYQEYKRVSDENEKLKRQLRAALSIIELYESESKDGGEL